jgi:hypothetical protein
LPCALRGSRRGMASGIESTFAGGGATASGVGAEGRRPAMEHPVSTHPHRQIAASNRTVAKESG